MHMRGALNLGMTKEEIKELIIHLSQYSGVPTAVEAMRVYREVTEPKQSLRPLSAEMLWGQKLVIDLSVLTAGVPAENKRV